MFSARPKPPIANPAQRRNFLRLAAAFIADHLLPAPGRAARLFARRSPALSPPENYRKPSHRAIIVTFGGGARYQDTFAPEGWANIPHLASDLAPKGILYPTARNEGVTGHFNSTAALITGSWQYVDSFGSEPPATPTIFEYFRRERRLPPEETWAIATNKSFSLIGGSKLRDYGDPLAANVILPKQLLLEAIQTAVSSNNGPGVEDRQSFAQQMITALDEGYESYGWQVYDRSHRISHELKASLAKSLLDYFNDPSVPSSGDELTFFMAKEVMNRFAPSLLLVNFWDIDIAHYGSYSLYLQAIERTDRLVYELWQHTESLPAYRDKTTMVVIPEVGRDGDIHGNGFANHRSGDDSCRRVWLLALGAGVPRGVAAERVIRHIDVAPTVAKLLGFNMESEGTPLGELAI